jgi:Tfp pilus assembly protein PilX
MKTQVKVVNMNGSLTTLQKYQKGAAVLVVSISLLIAVTLLIMYAARVGLLDQKISGNEYRHKEAFANAEAGVEQAASYLRANSALHEGGTGWTPCAGGPVTTPFGISPCAIKVGASLATPTLVLGTLVSPNITPTPISTLSNSQSYLVKTGDNTTVVGVGKSEDNTGVAVAQTEYAAVSLLTPGEIPPLMAPSMELSGNFTIVPNPNGGGVGVPVSAWVKTTATGTGTASWQTCNQGEFVDTGGQVCMDTLTDAVPWKSCGCSENLSEPTNIGTDLVLTDPDFPSSPFNFIFDGKSRDYVKDLAERDGKVIPNCGSANLSGPIGSPPETRVGGEFLSSLALPLVWVTGDCDFTSGSIIGSRENPIILIVEGDIKANGTFDLWGIILGLAAFDLNGTSVIHGSAISENPSDLTNGGYSQVYDESVFKALIEDTTSTEISKVKYSWRDFTP